MESRLLHFLEENPNTRGLLGLAWLEFYSVPRLSLLPPPGSGAQQGVDTLARLSLIETRDFTRQPQKGK